MAFEASACSACEANEWNEALPTSAARVASVECGSAVWRKHIRVTKRQRQPSTWAASGAIYFKDWYRRVIHTTLKPIKKVAKTIKPRLANVAIYCTHGITNAVAEGLNSKIMSIKRRAGVYRNRENFRTAIFFLLRWTENLPLRKPDGPI